MPSYHAELLSATGGRTRLSLTAASLPALALRLREQGYTLVRVAPPTPNPAARGYWRRVSDAEAVGFFRQLATALDNGVSLPAALALLAREARNPVLRAVLTDAERAVRSGDTLSGALSAYPRLFPPVYVRLIEAGEAGRRLPDVLRQVADCCERAGQAARRIRATLIYPQLVGGATLLTLAFCMTFVVPRFLELFRELGMREFPLVTQALFWMSMVGMPALFGFGAPAALLVFLWSRRSGSGEFWLQRLGQRLPVMGALHEQLSLLRLCRLLTALLQGGVPLPEALRLTAHGVGHPAFQAALWAAIPRVCAGEPLAAALGHTNVLPPSFCGQLAAAEATGELPATLLRMAEWYADRVDYLAARATALFEPICVLALAGMAGWVGFGILAPLVAVIQALSGGGGG